MNILLIIFYIFNFQKKNVLQIFYLYLLLKNCQNYQNLNELIRYKYPYILQLL